MMSILTTKFFVRVFRKSTLHLCCGKSKRRRSTEETEMHLSNWKLAQAVIALRLFICDCLAKAHSPILAEVFLEDGIDDQRGKLCGSIYGDARLRLLGDQKR